MAMETVHILGEMLDHDGTGTLVANARLSTNQSLTHQHR